MITPGMMWPAYAVLEPPYARAQPLAIGGRPAALGGILVWHPAGGAVEADSPILALQAAQPWCPLAVALREPIASPAQIELFRALRGQLAWLPAGPRAADPLQVVSAVVERPEGDLDQAIADYVARRLGHGTAERIVRVAVHGRDDDAISYRTLCRRLATLGSLGPTDWAVVAKLARFAGRRSLPAEQLAACYGCETRTLRAHCERYLGVPLADYAERAGWEWVIEGALRHNGYFEVRRAPGSRAAQAR